MHFLYFLRFPYNKKTLLFLVCVFFCLFCISAAPYFAPNQTAEPLLSSTSSENSSEKKEQKLAAITFDCSWGDEKTNEILSILSQNKVKATFFVTGTWAENHPESLLHINKEGHEIGSHSYSHQHFSKLTLEEKAEELLKSKAILSSSLQKTIRWFRPPYGDTDRQTFTAAKSAGLSCVLWDLDSKDWRNSPPKEIAAQIASNCKDGDILLFQNGALNTSSALDYLIPKMKADGFHFVTITELFEEH